TKWKGASNREGNGYKLWYSGSPTARNGVRVILKAFRKDKVVRANLCSDKIISLTFLIDRETVNVISAYASLILGGDLNGHIGAATEGYAGVYGGFAYGVRNEKVLTASDADSMWNILASNIKDVAKDTLSVAIRTSNTHMTKRESWWLCEEVKSKVAVKQARFRELLLCREAEAKEKAYEELYKKLESKEGANDIFRIAKAQERRRRDLGDMCFIKDKDG
ncbi:hypothetical protein Tco_1453188, partial [Tanacetum coccineum]